MAKIKLSLDINDKVGLIEASELIDLLLNKITGGEWLSEELPKDEPAKGVDFKKANTKKHTSPAQGLPSPNNIEITDKEKADYSFDPKTLKEETNDATVQVTDVRMAVAAKSQEHRATIKAKLTALGSGNVTNLDPAKYGEFMEFLAGL